MNVVKKMKEALQERREQRLQKSLRLVRRDKDKIVWEVVG